jgi:hypothetical protein
MAGRQRTGPYPEQMPLDADPQQHGDRAFPDIPQGYSTWNDYILAVLDANEKGEEAPRPYNVYGGDSIGDPDVNPMQWLQHSLGFARIAPYVDQSDPKIQQMLDSMYYANTSYDTFSPFGDQFFGALGMLGAAVGGAAAYGAFAPAAAGAAGAAGALGEGAGLGLGAGELAGVSGALGGAPGWASTVAQIAPYASWGGQGLQTVGALTDNKWLSNLGQALGYAGLIGGGVAGAAGGGGLGGAVSGALGGGGSGGGGMGTFDWTSLIGPTISAAGNIAGGAIASGAARNAANTQTQAAQEANRVLQEMYGQTRADLTPYRLAGYGALGNMIAQAQGPFDYGQYNPTQVLNPEQYSFDPSQHAFDVNQYQFNAPNQALSPADYQFNAPNQALNPADYRFAPVSGQQVLNDDPGYAFRMQEGMKAINASAAAKGGLQSGAALKAAQQYGQGLASQEYGQSYNRALGRNIQDWQRAQYGNEQQYNRALAENQQGWQRAQYGNEQQYNRALAQNQMGYERGLQGNQLGYERDLAANQLRYGRDYQMNTDVAQRNRDQYALNYQTALGGRQQQIGELQALANMGMGAQGQQNTATANLANALTGNITGAGAAQAAGQVGAANAWGGAMSGIGNSVNSYLQGQYAQNQQSQYNNLLQMIMAGRGGGGGASGGGYGF